EQLPHPAEGLDGLGIRIGAGHEFRRRRWWDLHLEELAPEPAVIAGPGRAPAQIGAIGQGIEKRAPDWRNLDTSLQLDGTEGGAGELQPLHGLVAQSARGQRAHRQRRIDAPLY